MAVIAIPDYVDLPGAPWSVLPAGVHPANLDAIANCFASNPWRRSLFNGLRRASENLVDAGCRRLYLDGSFVTAKPEPGDYDACWDPGGVDRTRIDPVFRDFSNRRAAQKEKYGGEFFVSTARADRFGRTFVEFFQVDKITGFQKGIVLVDLPGDSLLQSRAMP